MTLSPFHAYYKVRKLTSIAYGKDRFIPAFASSDIEIYPYQIAAAMFALRSPYMKGALLCDDGSLGKSFEAMLIITQRYYEGKERILIIVPTPLLNQWTKIIDSRFSVPLFSIDNNAVFAEHIENGTGNPFLQDGIVITTYDFAAEKAEYIAQIPWDLTVFEEAHHLRRIYTGENKGAVAIREAVKDSFKLLLTATPMQNSIMDLYGLIYFIDETVFPDEKTFYSRYFRKPENYPELSARASKYCFRTTRGQVSTYVKIPERIPITVEFTLTDKEQRLSDMVNAYLAREKKYAFPKMEQYDLTLMFFRTLSSSTFALEKTLQGIERRLAQMLDETSDPKLKEEHALIIQMLTLAKSIKDNAKGSELLTALKKGFAELKRLGAKKKALIFTENRATQKYLFDRLNKGEYKGKVLMYSGDSSRDYTIMERFEKEATILITTDLAAEGFNLEFCSFVVNYDLPYNTLKIEQRINRCHRQGQQSDVVILNFLNRNNFADVRMLELINKRILQFDSIIGLSDDVIGSFSTEPDFGKILATSRTKDEIDRAFDEVLIQYEAHNKQLVQTAEQSLFTSFSKDIADKVTVTPQYVQQKIQELNDDLWAVTTYFLRGKQGYICEDDTRTVRIGIQPQKIFTGAHLGRREYSMTDKTLPKSGWHTLTGTLAKNIFGQMFWNGIPDSGSVSVELGASSEELPCAVGYYRIKVKAKSDYFGGWYHNVFVGKTASGRILTHEECERIMELPVLSFTAENDTYGERDGISKQKRASELDGLISPEEYLQRTVTETLPAEKEEIERLTARTADQKVQLRRDIDALQAELKALDGGLGRVVNIAEKVKAEKLRTTTLKQLKVREQQLFLDDIRLDAALEEQIQQMVANAKLTAEITRHFAITITGGTRNG